MEIDDAGLAGGEEAKRRHKSPGFEARNRAFENQAAFISQREIVFGSRVPRLVGSISLYLRQGLQGALKGRLCVLLAKEECDIDKRTLFRERVCPVSPSAKRTTGLHISLSWVL